MTIVKIDAIDLRILDAIQRDARITKVALAEAVGLSPTPCWLRLRKLEKTGIVAGYHARIAPRLIARISNVLMEVTLARHHSQDFDRFEAAMLTEPEVVSCWAVGGGVDYLVKVVTSDIDAYQRFVDKLLDRDLGIARYFTYVVTKTVKDSFGPPLQVLTGAQAEAAR